MRLGIALLASCIYLLPIMAQAQSAPLANALLSTPLVLPASVIPYGYDLPKRVSSGVAATSDRLFENDSNLRMRLGVSMVDYYPIGGQAFHLSVGLRLFARHNFVREAERASGQRLSTPRGFPGLGSGVRRYTPAAMIGYNLPLYPDASLGFEGGAVAGRLDSIAPGLDGRHSLAAVHMYPQSRINPVIRTALALRF
ncbi:MAG: hypothetical protein JF595_17420 [Sphingomonadales bacterium]|nr:hypothetical protein [Sphingomonadales bacterium]